MKAYRFAIYRRTQMGFLIGFEYGFFTIDLPFLKIMVNVTKDAHGTNF